MKRSIINVLQFFLILILIAFFAPKMKIFDRPIWHSPKQIIDYDLDGPGTSQQIFDIYSFSHITHGIIFYFILYWLGYRKDLILYIAVIIEILWEVFENTPFIIKKYRNNFPEYKGDSVINIIGDTIFAVIGVYLTYLSPKLALAFMVILEIILYPFKANFLYLSIGSLL